MLHLGAECCQFCLSLTSNGVGEKGHRTAPQPRYGAELTAGALSINAVLWNSLSERRSEGLAFTNPSCCKVDTWRIGIPVVIDTVARFYVKVRERRCNDGPFHVKHVPVILSDYDDQLC